MKNKKLLGLSLAVLASIPVSASALTKNEMVYSNIDYDGSTTKTLVTNHLSNVSGSVNDYSELQNIININGNETFALENNKLTWNSLDKDIFYQGSTEKELPIKTTVKYYFNGEEKKVNDILGQKGSVKIVFTFQNTSSETVKVNGKNEILYTPFITMVGGSVDSEKNHNVNITNGKVVSTGTRDMILGIASPGLYESTNISELKDLNTITLSFDTDCFELKNIYIVSTPKLLENTDLSIFDKMDNAYSDVKTLSSSMDKIESGMKDLATGISSLNHGTESLQKSLKTVEGHMTEIKNGSIDLDTGLKAILTELNKAKQELSSSDITSSITKLKTLEATNTSVITSTLKKTGKDLPVLKATYEKYTLDKLNESQIDAMPVDETTKTQLKGVKNAYELIELLTANNMAIESSISGLTTMASKLQTLVTSLSTAITTAEEGSSKLSIGLTEMSVGIAKLYQGSTSLNEGSSKLNTGAQTLVSGTSKFNQEGIKKLTNYAYSLMSYKDKVEALVNLSKEYNGFTSNNDASTIFVSMMKSAKTNCLNSEDND